MSQSLLELTEFRVEKLQCIGSSSNTSPYRITTYRSIELGVLGCIPQAPIEAANSPVFEVHYFQGIKRLLRVLAP